MDRREEILTKIAHEEQQIAALKAEQAGIILRITSLREELAALSQNGSESPAPKTPALSSSTPASNADKVTLLRSLFRGRDDVFALRWENHRTGKSGYAPACDNEWREGVCDKLKPVKRKGVSVCGLCASQSFRPVTDEEIVRHLRGDHVMGIYPLLKDDTCCLFAIDFDGEDWKADVRALSAACRRLGLMASIERSRSGQGAHAWFFFAEHVPAALARRFGSALLSSAMADRHQMSFRSFDRFFPNQDLLPRGGFGNLIALPLQRIPRENGNTVFIQEDLTEHADQWQYLSAIDLINSSQLNSIAGQGGRGGIVLDFESGQLSAAAATPHAADSGEETGSFPMPANVELTLSSRLVISKSGLPSFILRGLKELAAFSNPEFYQRQRMRLSTALTPRFITCFEENTGHLILPRGCLEAAKELLMKNGAAVLVHDERNPGTPVSATFTGILNPLQQVAVEQMLNHEYGVLVAPPGIGKTVMGCSIIAERGCNTLVIVHRQEIARLAAISEGEERLLIATGRYIGEGFDDGRLDTLFLGLPVSWKGTLIQYAGRLHRAHPGKHEVVVHDYLDQHVPVLVKMFEKRQRGYRAMGYL